LPSRKRSCNVGCKIQIKLKNSLPTRSQKEVKENKLVIKKRSCNVDCKIQIKLKNSLATRSEKEGKENKSSNQEKIM
jgi:hypothetical protein